MLIFKKFTKENAHLIRPWFDDPDTKKWLGGSSWVDNSLTQQSKAVGEEFRGAKTIARNAWVVFDRDTCVGFIDGDVSDRYVKYSEEDGKPVFLEIEDKLTSGIAFVINPDERKKGYGSQMIQELTQRPELEKVEIFLAGVEPENTGSIKALESAGFTSDYETDFEGMIYFFYRR